MRFIQTLINYTYLKPIQYSYPNFASFANIISFQWTFPIFIWYSLTTILNTTLAKVNVSWSNVNIQCRRPTTNCTAYCYTDVVIHYNTKYSYRTSAKFPYWNSVRYAYLELCSTHPNLHSSKNSLNYLLKMKLTGIVRPHAILVLKLWSNAHI